jgi:hypothetical protein
MNRPGCEDGVKLALTNFVVIMKDVGRLVGRFFQPVITAFVFSK